MFDDDDVTDFGDDTDATAEESASPAEPTEDTPEAPDQSQETAEEETQPEGEQPEGDAQPTETKGRTDWRGEYFRFKKEAEPQIAELATAREKLAQYESEGPFIGLKVDAPAEQWDVGKQLGELPSPYYKVLAGEIMEKHLEPMANEVLTSPTEYPEEYRVFAGAADTIASRAFGRHIDEVVAIANLTQGIPLQQLQAIFSGQAQTGGYPTTAAGAQYQSQPPLSQLLISQNFDPTDPVVLAARYQEQQATAYQTAYGQLQSQLRALQGRLDKQDTTRREADVQQVVGEYDTRAEQARTGALDSVTKDRVPPEQLEDVRDTIDARAMRLVTQDQKAQQALTMARAWAKDAQNAASPEEARTMKAKADGQFGVYAARVGEHYKQIAAKVLNGYVVPASQAKTATDRAKAARKDLSGGRGTVQGATPKPAVGGKVPRDRDFGDYVGQQIGEYRRSVS